MKCLEILAVLSYIMMWIQSLPEVGVDFLEQISQQLKAAKMRPCNLAIWS